jgi:hypothetical protein
MNPYTEYPLGWFPVETQRDQSERAHQRWLRSQAVRQRRRLPLRPTQPSR